MIEKDKAAELLEGISQIVSSPALQDDLSLRKKAIQFSKQLTVALDEPANTAVELIFAVSSTSQAPPRS